MGTSRRKLLLVDDDFVVLSLLSNLFTDKYDVIEKRSCSEALEYLNKEHVDCIVLDLVMEGVDGFGFLSTYNKAKNKQPFVPVVVISSLDNIEARQKAFSLGAVDFIAKPFNSFDVKNRVDNLVSIFHLVSKQEQSQVKYKTMARVDELTHIDNRRGLKAKTENLFGPKADGSTYVFMFDIDDFKSINDTGGHFTGDLVLIKFASLLKSFVERDDALGRIGGDEFILVKTKQNDESALKIGNQILKRVEEKSFGNLENQLSTSFGVVSVPNGMSFEGAYSNADKLLYQAKNEGKNCFCFLGKAHRNESKGIKKTILLLSNSVENSKWIKNALSSRGFAVQRLYFYEELSRVLLPSYKALTELLIDFTTYDKQSEIMDYINSLGLSKKFKIVGLVKEGDMTNTALALTLKPVDIISLPLSVSNFERRIKTAFTKEGK